MEFPFWKHHQGGRGQLLPAGRPANERTAEKKDEDRTAVDVAVVKVGEKGEHPPTNTTGPPI